MVSALSLADALLGALGLILAAMTGAAGILVIADARADIAAARAWQDIHAELALIATPGEGTPSDRVDALRMAGPQDESLRRILLAHRCMMPVSPFSDPGLAELACADAVADGKTASVGSGTAFLIAGQRPAADRHSARIAATSDAAFDCPPLLIAGKLKDIGRRGHHSTKRRVSRALLVANTGAWWNFPTPFQVDARRAPADVIVLADRSGRDGNAAHRDIASQPATTAPPGCRGPPSGATQRQVTAGPGPICKSLRENDRPRADAPADPVVIDNLGENVPVGAAELEVVEAYLDDVLRELLAAVASSQDHGGS